MQVFKVTWKVQVTRMVTAEDKAEALLIAEDLAYGNFRDEHIEYLEVTVPRATKVLGS